MKGRWVAIAGVTGLIAVAAGAFGAHFLKDRLSPDDLANFEVAVRYQMYHALALLAVAFVASMRPSRAASASAVCMVLGVVLFCGSLYGLALMDWRFLGPVTPIGGVLFICGWLLLVVAALGRPAAGNSSDP